MKIPKKITPDCLKDTIVEIRVRYSLPRELVIGYASSILSPLRFQYAPIPVQNTSSVNFALGVNGGGFFIRDQKIRMQLTDDLISFNCIENNYVGWDSYFKTIIEVINSLLNSQLVKSVNRVSVRYISEFKNIEILKNINGSVNINGFNLDNTILRLTEEAENIKTFITLTNKGKVILPQTQQIIEVSLVDINVFENFNPITNIDELQEKLNNVHLKQKNTFFNLITENFLQTLNPEY